MAFQSGSPSLIPRPVNEGSGYETSATLQAGTHDYSVHGTVMEELSQLNEYSVVIH